MQTGMFHLHSYLAYLALGLLVITVVVALLNTLGNKPFGSLSKLAKFTLISVHTQFLIGIILYVVEGRYVEMGEKMKISAERLLALEHPLVMLFAVILITVGNKKAKVAVADASKNKNILIFFGISLVLILSRIPWQNWF